MYDSDMQMLLDTLPLSMAFFDTEYNMLYCSQEIVQLLGAPSKQDFMENLFKYIPEYQPCGTLSVQKLSNLMGDVTIQDMNAFEWALRDVNGKHVVLSIVGVRGEYRGVQGYFICSHDNREAKAVKERMQLMFDAMPLLISYWKDGNCLDCNQFALDTYGFETKHEYLQNVYTFWPEYQPDGTRTSDKWQEHANIVMTQGYSNYSFVEKKPNGDLIYYDVNAIRLETDGEFIMAVCSRDVTERVHKEIALANSEAKSQFLARMSHELRTPISIILGISEIELQNPGSSAHEDEVFAKIHESAAMLLSLVNDILDLSKIEAGQMELAEAPYDITTLIWDLINVYPIYKGDKDIQFELLVDESLPVSYMGDSLRIKQILINILSNAFKYTEQGTVKLSFTCVKKDDDHITLEIKIADTGLGMNPDQVEKMFNEYARFHKNKHSATAGTGLGMAIVRSILQLMGGIINIDSQEGSGTCITICLRQKIAGSSVLGKEMTDSMQQLKMDYRSIAERFKFKPSIMSHGKVLVVDDIDANLYVAKGLLSFYDLQVDTCLSGFEAIEKINQGTVYDIVFMDHMMPQMNGTEAMKTLREMGYSKPIVVLTANALIGQAKEFAKQGFDGFISKPINVNHLDAILNKFIQNMPVAGGPETVTDDIDNYLADIMPELRAEFAQSQENTIEEIRQAIAEGDTETIYRKAHSLKGLAGLINEDALAKAAETFEKFAGAGRIDSGCLAAVESELKIVLDKICTVEKTTISYNLNNEHAKAILDKLQPLLASRNTTCLELLDELRTIPESAVLAMQIEDYDFSAALKTLTVLRRVLNV